MAPKPKLIYFDIRGRGELIRLVLKAANVDFDDERVQFPDWPARKHEAPNGQLPYMEIEGKKYSESLPLARYLAKKHGLAGKNELEVLSTDIILNVVDDLRGDYLRYKFDSVLNEEQKKTVATKFREEKCPSAYQKLENILIESKSGYLVGSGVTIADLAVADLNDQMEIENPGFVANYTKVTEHTKKIKAMPKLAAYLSGRKETQM